MKRAFTQVSGTWHPAKKHQPDDRCDYQAQKTGVRTSKGYPDIRTITGSYMMNEVTFIKED